MNKERLKEYRWIKDNIENLSQTLTELRGEAECKSPTLSDMPRTNAERFDAIPELVVRITEVEDVLRQKIIEACDLLEEIESAIEKLPERERLLIRMRYISRREWEYISDEMHYSQQMIFNIHKGALDILEAL